MTTETQQGTPDLTAAATGMIAGATDSLAQLLDAPVGLKFSSVSGEGALPPVIPAGGAGIEIIFGGALAGSTRLVMSEADAKAIVTMRRTAQDGAEVDLEDQDALSTLTEAITQFSSGAADALTRALGSAVELSPQSVAVNPGPQPDKIDLVVVTYESTIANGPGSELFWEIDHDLAQTLITQWPPPAPDAPDTDAVPTAPTAPSPSPAAMPTPQPTAGGGVIDSVELDVAVELGNVALSIGELLRLGEGSVVTLTQSIGDDVVLLANGTPVASGEVVVVDGTLGFRVSGLITDTRGA